MHICKKSAKTLLLHFLCQILHIITHFAAPIAVPFLSLCSSFALRSHYGRHSYVPVPLFCFAPSGCKGTAFSGHLQIFSFANLSHDKFPYGKSRFVPFAGYPYVAICSFSEHGPVMVKFFYRFTTNRDTQLSAPAVKFSFETISPPVRLLYRPFLHGG